MPRRIFVLISLAMFLFAFGCADTDSGRSPFGDDGVTLVSESDTSLTFSAGIDFVEPVTIDTKGGRFFTVDLPGYSRYGEIGEPALPAIRKLLLLPVGAEIKVTAEAADVEILDIQGRILPNQAPVEKLPGAFARAEFRIDEDTYNQDGWIVGEYAALVDDVMFRNHRLGMIEIRPVDYNPVAGQISVAHSLKVTLQYENADFDRTVELAERFGSSVFDSMLGWMVANQGGKWARFTQPTAGADYLIIHANNFRFAPALNTFETMKESEGWTVHRVNADDIGADAVAIHDYIVDQYNSLPNLAFVLLVGDTDTIPSIPGFASESPATDLYYGCITQDYIPDLLVGRFPVRTWATLSNMVDKIDAYTSNGGNWLSNAAFMSSNDNFNITEGTHNIVIDLFLDPAGYSVQKLYSHTNSATTAQVTSAFNSGLSYGIYSGHGDVTLWADGPIFTARKVRALTNTQYPFVCSFACLTGKYQTDECFAETWVRDDHGAAAMIASSVTSYWDEDDWFEKAMFLGLYNFPFPAYPNQVWAGAANLVGKAGVWVKSNGGGSTHRYFEMYNLFGDPSMVIHTNLIGG